MSALLIVAALALVAVNAFFVAMEFALIASRRSRLEALADAGNARARSALAAMRDLTRQLAGAQLGITLASLGLGYLGEPTIAHYFEELFHGLPETLNHILSFAIALLIVVLLHMVLGEMVPKNVALAGAERTAMLLAGPHRAFVTLCSPLIWLLNGLANLGVRLCGAQVVDELGTAHTAQELVTLVDASKGHGLINDFAHGLLSGALDLGARPVAEILIPVDQMVWASQGDSVAAIMALAERSGHSRVPIAGDAGVDQLVGFVHVKDLLLVEPEATVRPLERAVLRRMLVVSPERSLEDLLRWMRRDHLHVAWVRTAEGRTAGIVTLEDVLEELVGEIVDESDRLRAAVAPR